MADDLKDLTEHVRARVTALGFELADVRQGGSRTRPLLQVRIDRPDIAPGTGVTVDDCARVSRALEQWLDEAGILGPRYILEVSSPGIERPVRWREHWVRFIGKDVSVRLAGKGRVRATIVSVPDTGDTVVLRLHETGDEVSVTLAEARDARLAVDWEMMKKR
jgi:ribosome maturation factor RimP